MYSQQENIDEVGSNKKRSRLGFGAGLGVGLIIGAIAVAISIFILVGKIDDLHKYDSELLDNNAKLKIKMLSQLIDNYYYDYKDEPTSVQDMRESMYKGMVDSLDDIYSEYYTAEEIQEELLDAQGIYYGVGAYISIGEDNYPVFVRIMRDTPAEEVGLRDGDIIVQVDDESTYGFSLEETVSRVKGEEGTVVHITVYREGEEDYLEFDVTRRAIEQVSVGGELLDDGVGYIQITAFENGTSKQFAYEYEELRKKRIKGLIIDLRSNTGGLVDSVVDIARQILPEGVIVYEKDKKGNRTEFTCDGANEIDIPLVLLVNEYSASASEILTGAVKDYGIGTIVGKKTFGKGIVQSTRSLSDGSAVKLTTSAYFSPNGINIQGTGIEPDVEAEFDGDKYYNEGQDIQLDKAIEVLQEMMK